MRYCVAILILLFAGMNVSAKTIIVGRGGTYVSLKAAIDHSRDGDTIILRNGIYKEAGIRLTKSISLLGEGNPVLEGENKYEILLVSGKNILIRGIEFRNSGYSAMQDFASIKLVDAENVIIEKNYIRNAYFAIHISNSRKVTVRNNLIFGSPSTEQLTGNGIHLWKCSEAQILDNYIRGHRDGIYFEFVTHSSIRGNTSEKNIRYGLHFMFSNDDRYIGNIFRDNGAGVAVMYSKKVTMQRNHFEKNWGPSAYGILLKDISDGIMQENVFYRNTVGVHMEGSSRMKIERNQFRENGWAIKVQASCDNNDFLQNNFTGNSFDVGTNGSLSLNNFQNNYWDKYEGYDINKDGIGDVPYRPVSLYSMIVEQNPSTLILLRSFTISLLDKAERVIPSLTPGNLTDEKPAMKRIVSGQ